MAANQMKNDDRIPEDESQRVDLVERVRPEVPTNVLLISFILGLFWLFYVGSFIALVVGGYGIYADRKNGKIRYLSVGVFAVGFAGFVFLLLAVIAFKFSGEMTEVAGPM